MIICFSEFERTRNHYPGDTDIPHDDSRDYDYDRGDPYYDRRGPTRGPDMGHDQYRDDDYPRDDRRPPPFRRDGYDDRDRDRPPYDRRDPYYDGPPPHGERPPPPGGDRHPPPGGDRHPPPGGERHPPPGGMGRDDYTDQPMEEEDQEEDVIISTNFPDEEEREVWDPLKDPREDRPLAPPDLKRNERYVGYRHEGGICRLAICFCGIMLCLISSE